MWTAGGRQKFLHHFCGRAVAHKRAGRRAGGRASRWRYELERGVQVRASSNSLPVIGALDAANLAHRKDSFLQGQTAFSICSSRRQGHDMGIGDQWLAAAPQRKSCEKPRCFPNLLENLQKLFF